MNRVFGMLIFDTVLYFFIAWYVEAVHPGEYGVARPFYFFLTRTYWFAFFLCAFSFVDEQAQANIKVTLLISCVFVY